MPENTLYNVLRGVRQNQMRLVLNVEAIIRRNHYSEISIKHAAKYEVIP